MNDDELIGRLANAFPPVPERTLAIGQAAYGWYVPAATLAAVTSDSADTPPGVRGGGPRALSFGDPEAGVEIEVRGREIVGQLIPPAEAEVVLRSPEGERAARTDEAGGFVFLDVPPGPVSLLFRPGGASPVVTSWIRV